MQQNYNFVISFEHILCASKPKFFWLECPQILLMISKQTYTHRTPWSCGLIHHVLDREFKGLNLGTINSSFGRLQKRRMRNEEKRKVRWRREATKIGPANLSNLIKAIGSRIGLLFRTPTCLNKIIMAKVRWDGIETQIINFKRVGCHLVTLSEYNWLDYIRMCLFSS